MATEDERKDAVCLPPPSYSSSSPNTRQIEREKERERDRAINGGRKRKESFSSTPHLPLQKGGEASSTCVAMTKKDASECCTLQERSGSNPCGTFSSAEKGNAIG